MAFVVSSFNRLLLPRAAKCSRERRMHTSTHMAVETLATEENQDEVGETRVSGKSTANVLDEEVSRRRNLAIISHPDAGKTTLTEKLLLYGGAIQQAGSVRARRAGHKLARSDWMKMEQERGISITSTVLTFNYLDHHVNILDTPGHQDFSEDTYRTLAAADNVVMLVDAAKGLEPQTRKLFEVCQMRKLPTMTFVNKMDRPAMNAFEICDQIEQEFDIETVPAAWPIGDGENFKGVLKRSTKTVHLYERGTRGKAADVMELSLDSPDLVGVIGQELYDQLMEDVEILDTMGHELDEDKLLHGDQTIVYFGSAMTNFGVQLFLDDFLGLGRKPAERESTIGPINPTRENFSAFVFKLQANMDPRHRDRLAFIRIVSGTYAKGMKVSHSRLSNRQVTLSQAQKLFADDRESVEIAYPGDIVGLNNPGIFSIGDTIYTGTEKVAFPGIPSFSPEMFAYIRNPNPSNYKNFKKGLNQLLEEGAVQMLRAKEDQGGEDPILAAVGQLQFDVVQQRLRDEYGVDSKLEVMPYSVTRWVLGPGDPWEALEKCGRIFSVFYAKDRWNRPVLLFKNQWNLNQLEGDHGDKLELKPWAFAPEDA
mmetsp:Transcript_5942/g.17888  ORF Transcript_5942/g.17888 Transcript_5942/m.17888 type:complete len:595 (-) Transcript_5942:1517-3301(-)